MSEQLLTNENMVQQVRVKYYAQKKWSNIHYPSGIQKNSPIENVF